VTAKNAAEMTLSRIAQAEAERRYWDAFETHAEAEQIAVAWSQFSEAQTHRLALEMVLQRGDEEINIRSGLK
jgi:hypothetical protein